MSKRTKKKTTITGNGRIDVSEAATRRALTQCRVRLMCVGLFFVLGFTVVSLRLVELGLRTYSGEQNVAADATESVSAEKLTLDESPAIILPRRDIVDRNGQVLATSLATRSLYADPKEIKKPRDIAVKLNRIFPSLSTDWIEKRLTRKGRFVWIKRNLTPKEQYQANMLGVPGLYFQDEHARVYPQGKLLAHVLGFVGVDNQGLAGIEKYFDRDLNVAEPTGDPLQLSIDLRLQHLIYDRVEQAIDEFRAHAGGGLIYDMKNGEVLAYTSQPSFDPHHPGEADKEQRFNRLSLGTYEMGSTFKTFTTAMALDSGTTKMDGGYDASKPIRFGGFTIHDTHAKARWLTVPEIFAYSSNIGTVKMALDVGMERQQDFLTRLNMFQPVGIEIPERATPKRPNPWEKINMMTISFGHGVAVTPLHLVSGTAAMLNGGRLERMTLIKDKPGPVFTNRIIREETSQNMRRLLRTVVQYGTARFADVPGYKVGGKTGTAEKADVGGYNRKALIASFIGAFPMDNPRYLVLIMLDEAKGNKNTYGYATAGWVAAPAAGRLISQMGPMLSLEEDFSEKPDSIDRYWAEMKIREERARVHAAGY
ncbi:MAG: penicillin-binding protein 2 [Rickettsiales bacterium]